MPLISQLCFLPDIPPFNILEPNDLGPMLTRSSHLLGYAPTPLHMPLCMGVSVPACTQPIWIITVVLSSSGSSGSSWPTGSPRSVAFLKNKCYF